MTKRVVVEEERPPARQLEPDLQEFYNRHGIQVSSLLSAASDGGGFENPFRYRFIRLNPRHEIQETLRRLKEEQNGADSPIRVSWLRTDNFFALPGSFRLNSSPSFRSGRIYGMDVSSGASVSVLLSSSYDKGGSHNNNSADTPFDSPSKPVRVIDLCCCPGLKLCAIADQVPTGSTVIGVDVSEGRMAVCSKILEKYHVDRETSGRGQRGSAKKDSAEDEARTTIQLFCQDGTSFGMAGVEPNLVFDSNVAIEEAETKGDRKRKNKSARARERKRLKQIAANTIPSGGLDTSLNGKYPPQEITMELFDHVLVDAECSTDGSLKHLRETLKGGEDLPSNRLLTDQDQLDALVDLQRRLLAAGYRLLKPGGTLVYSTCSLSQDQNEKVVSWLLKEHQSSFLIPVEFSLARSNLVVRGSIDGTVRFYPNIGQEQEDALFGDGFFLAKISKR